MTDNKIGRYIGIVKRWDYVRGYGFIVMLKKHRDLTEQQLVYIHRNEIREDYKELYDQQVVEFDLYASPVNENKKTFKARELRQIRSGFKLFSSVSRGSKF
jgi:cold shock CspA family protein